MHFYIDLINDCLIQDEASQVVQHLCFHQHQMDGVGPASLRGMLRVLTHKKSWGYQPRKEPYVFQQRVGDKYCHQASPLKV